MTPCREPDLDWSPTGEPDEEGDYPLCGQSATEVVIDGFTQDLCILHATQLTGRKKP